jgi:gliding motility-associated-like protein
LAKANPANPPPVEENKISNTSAQNRQVANEEFAPGFAKIDDYLAPDDFNRKELPNSFSPNGDHTNDVFKIKTHDLKTLEVIIFDTGGREVYSWKSLNGEWDGRLPDGAEAPAGNYYYSLNAETTDGKICIGQSFLKLFR